MNTTFNRKAVILDLIITTTKLQTKRTLTKTKNELWSQRYERAKYCS